MNIYRRSNAHLAVARVVPPAPSQHPFSGLVGFGHTGLGLPRDRRAAKKAATAAREAEIAAYQATIPAGTKPTVVTTQASTSVTAQAGGPTADMLQHQANIQVQASLLATALAETAARQGNTELAQSFTAQAAAKIETANQLVGQIVSPTQNEAPRPMYDAATVQARGVVDTYTAALNDTVQTLVKPQLFPDGVQQFKSDVQTEAMLQYPSALLPCSAENTARIGVRPDIYVRAQQALAQLSVVRPPWAGNSQPLGSLQRDYAARLFADWLTCVYGWVSLAYFACNIQPLFLNPAAPDTMVTGADGKAGAIAPDKALPPEMQSVINDLMGAPAPDPTQIYHKEDYRADLYAQGTSQDGIRSPHEALEQRSWGPLWAGMYSSEAWLRGEFKPAYDPRTLGHLVNEAEKIYPQNYIQQSDATTTQGATTSRAPGDIRRDLADPWHFWYQQALHNSPGQTTYAITRFIGKSFGGAIYEGAADRTRVFVYPSFDGVARMAVGWCNAIMGTSIADHTLNATIWYLTNHVTYWAERGLIDMNIEEARTYQVAASKAQVEANAQRAQQMISQIGGTVAPLAASNPLALGITVGATTLASGITTLVAMRRMKKAGRKADVMQPLVLRTLSEVPCSAFDRGGTLPDALILALSNLTNEIAGGGAAAVTTVTVAPNLAPAADGSIVASPVITTVTTSAEALAPNPQTLPVYVSPGDSVTTSTSTSQPTATGIVPTPMPSSSDLQTAILNAANVPSVVPATGGVPWLLVGGGALVALGLVYAVRRKR